MLPFRSPGHIVSASVHPFTAMSAEGEMLVVVENNGTLDSEFTVGVGLSFRCLAWLIVTGTLAVTANPYNDSPLVRITGSAKSALFMPDSRTQSVTLRMTCS